MLLYVESMPLYVESMPSYVERMPLYVESMPLYFESVILYFPQCLGKEKVVIDVHFTNANLLAVGDTTFAYFFVDGWRNFKGLKMKVYSFFFKGE